MEKKEEKINNLRFSTGSDLLDLVVGGGLGEGFPAGKIVNVVGDKSSGKTFLTQALGFPGNVDIFSSLNLSFDQNRQLQDVLSGQPPDRVAG